MSDVETKALNEQYSSQMAETVKSVYDLTTRLDERVQNLSRSNIEMERRLEVSNNNASSLAQRVATVESKRISDEVEKVSATVRHLEMDVEKLKTDTGRSGERWKQIIQFGFQVAGAILIAYLLYKLHIGK
jgi:predicted RNase H-like nuclease (RuvC/YqgF family)